MNDDIQTLTPQVVVAVLEQQIEALFDVLIQANLDLGQPEQAERLRVDLPEVIGQARAVLFPQFLTREGLASCDALNEIGKDPGKSLDRHWESIAPELKKLCPAVSPMSLVAAMIISPTIDTLPPHHPLLTAMGLNDIGDWNRLSPSVRLAKLLGVWLDETRRGHLVRKAVQLLVNQAEDQGASEKVRYVSEYSGAQLATEDKGDWVDDADRLSQFCERAGMDMTSLTDGEKNRVLDLLQALDQGYTFSSKTGVSMAAYYGDQRADSEKTQRQRVFKKIKELKKIRQAQDGKRQT